jgi:hypothetical protein
MELVILNGKMVLIIKEIIIKGRDKEKGIFIIKRIIV